MNGLKQIFKRNRSVQIAFLSRNKILRPFRLKICLDLQNIIYVRWGCNMLEHKIVEESDGNDSEDSDEDFFDCRETLSLRSRTASIPSVESDGGKV